jgi:hypothetical protein
MLAVIKILLGKHWGSLCPHSHGKPHIAYLSRCKLYQREALVDPSTKLSPQNNLPWANWRPTPLVLGSHSIYPYRTFCNPDPQASFGAAYGLCWLSPSQASSWHLGSCCFPWNILRSRSLTLHNHSVSKIANPILVSLTCITAAAHLSWFQTSAFTTLQSRSVRITLTSEIIPSLSISVCAISV